MRRLRRCRQRMSKWLPDMGLFGTPPFASTCISSVIVGRFSLIGEGEIEATLFRRLRRASPRSETTTELSFKRGEKANQCQSTLVNFSFYHK